MIMKAILVTLIVLTLCPFYTEGHGRMMDPPARNSMWRLGFNNPINYNDNELYCGGRMVQWIRNKGKCGICGDAYHGKRDHEAGGKFANGIIGRSYHEGDIIPVVVHLTANHQGWFEFKLCPVNNVKEKVTQKCLDANVLQRADGKGTTFPIPQGKYNAFFNFSVKLPEGLTCKQCVMQWKYRTGNTWDKDDKSGVFCLGCGPQEEFYNCADVEILPKGKKSHWIKATVSNTPSDQAETITIAPKMNSPKMKGNQNQLKKTYTTQKPSKNIANKAKISVKKLTTPKPTKTGSLKNKLNSKYNSKNDKTSSQTYLIEPKIESAEKPWKAASTSKKLTKWLKKTTKASPVKSKSVFNKPKKTKLPSWLVNTRKIKERRRKLIARRQELLRRQQALRRQQNTRRYRPRTTASTTTTVGPTTTTISSTKPPNRILFNKETKQTPPCITEHAGDSPSMIASTDMPDTPAIVLREGLPHHTKVPPKTSYESISPQEIEKARGMSGDLRFENVEPESKTENGYVVEYPEHPVVENENPSHPQVHRHRLPFQSKSPFANPSSPHANPLISYWWNQYQRPILSLWNNVRPVLKCHATITLGGGMDEWCTANCNANFCPGGMCVCQPETSVYPTYSVYPPQSQGWMNSFNPSLRVDTPKPMPRKNPYIMRRQQRRQHDSYRRENIKQQQLPPAYTARNTVNRNIVVEEPSHHIKRLFAPTLRKNTKTGTLTTDKTSESTGLKVHKRSTSSTTSTTELPITTPIKTTSPIPPTTVTPTTPKTSTKSKPKAAATTSPTPSTRKSPVPDQDAKEVKFNKISFKAANRSYRLPKRTSLAWVIKTEKSTRAMNHKTTVKQTTLPDRTYKASPSSHNAINKTQSRRSRLRSKAHFWRRKGNYNCHAIGRYAGLKRFDNWCSRNCMQTICPLLICQCEVIQ